MAKRRKLPEPTEEELREFVKFMEEQARINAYVLGILNKPQPRVPAAQLINAKLAGQFNRRDGNKFGKPPHGNN